MKNGKKKMRLTVKQIELITVISRATQNGECLDFEQILDRINYETTKQSLVFSIRALIKHKMIIKKGFEKRNNRLIMTIEATPLGCSTVNPLESKTPQPAYVLSVEDDELASESDY